MKRLRDFLKLIKLGIVGSNALSAAGGFALAAAGRGLPPWGRGAVLLAGTSLLVGGSCAVNNWLDRDVDAMMERTRERPTARGSMGAPQALGIGAGLVAAGLALLLGLGPVPAALGAAGAAIYVFAYTLWAKRRGGTSSLLVGGIAGAIPPLIGWAAVDPRLGGAAWSLFAFLAAWQQAHVRALALKRAGEYRSAGIPMAGLSPRTGRGAPRTGLGAPRAAALAWIAATLPFPALALALGGRPLVGARLSGALASAALCLGWLASGLIGLRSESWPRRMFAASLAFLVLVFGVLITASAF